MLACGNSFLNIEKMVWIKIHNEAKANCHVYNDELMDERVDLSENCTANVSEEVAERIVDYYDLAEYYESEDAEAE